MKVRSGLPRRLLFLSLILYASVVQANAAGPLKFSLHPGAGVVHDPFAGRNFAGSSQYLWQTAGYGLGQGESGLPVKKTAERKFYLLNLSMGIGAYLRERHDLTGTLGLGFSLSYLSGRHFFGARLVSAAFMDGGGRDLSLLYGRAWKSGSLLFSLASGIGLSAFDEIGSNDPNFGLPLDMKALVLSTKRGGLSLGIHGFAFLAAAYRYFGICLNLGVAVSGH